MRIYDIEKDGVEVHYPSVTTILGILPLPEGLVNWQAFNPNADAYMEERAMVGSTAHYYFECKSSKALPNHSPVLERDIAWKYLNPTTAEKIGNICRKITLMMQMNEFEPLYVEEKVWSHRVKVAGRVDFIGYLNGEKAIVDLKTSRKFFDDPDKLYDNHEVQLSAYAIAAKESLGFEPEKLAIMRVNENNKPEIRFKDFNPEAVEDVRRLFYDEHGI